MGDIKVAVYGLVREDYAVNGTTYHKFVHKL